MTVTAVTTLQLEYPTDIYNATAIKAWVDAVTTAANLGTIAGGALTADGPGRAAFAANFFDATTVAAKFAAGCFAANGTIRALFAAGLIDSATATSIIAAGAIPASKLATAAAPATLSGPGAIDVTKGQTSFTSTGAGNALTLANGTYAGQKVVVFHSVKGASGTGVITPTTFDHTSVTLTAVYDSVEFIWTGSTWTLGRLIGATAVVTG